MTEPRSWVALAQEIYADAVAEDPVLGPARSLSQRTPTPNPSPQGGGEQAELRRREKSERGGGERAGQRPPTQQTELSARTRTMYEETCVPVREIARLAGVTERTIYKYARKQNWAPRYIWNDEGTRPRGASWRAGGALAPAQGAGGRFIARADRGKPVATGLRATDPQAAMRAAQDCAAASAAEHAAYISAMKIRQQDERDRAWTRINKALHALERYRERKTEAAVRSEFGRMGHPGERAEFRRKNMQTRIKYGEEHDRGERPLWAEIRAATEYVGLLQKLHGRTLAEARAQGPAIGTS